MWLPGGGAPAAHGAIKALRLAGPGHRLVTTDANPLSAGFAIADAYRVLPAARDGGYLAAAMQWIRDEAIDVVLPTSGFDLVPLAAHRSEIEAAGVTVAFSDHEQLELCNDKLRLMQRLSADFPLAPFTSSPGEAQFPCFVKPVKGKGGHGTTVCWNRDQLTQLWRDAQENLLIQDYLPGVEYSVDVLSDLHGQARYAVARIRIETRGGIASKGRVLRHPLLEDTCLEMASSLRLKGPTCFQFRENRDGQPRLLEINPRLGGATIMAVLAGANLPLDTVRMVQGLQVSAPDIRETIVLRVFDEIVWPVSRADS